MRTDIGEPPLKRRHDGPQLLSDKEFKHCNAAGMEFNPLGAFNQSTLTANAFIR